MGNMKITVFLGIDETGHSLEVQVPSANCSVGEVLSIIRAQLNPVFIRVLEHSERYGSKVFLSSGGREPIRLHEHLRLCDYQFHSDCKLWLACSHDQIRT